MTSPIKPPIRELADGQPDESTIERMSHLTHGLPLLIDVFAPE
jgi:hypothetical protein